MYNTCSLFVLCIVHQRTGLPDSVMRQTPVRTFRRDVSSHEGSGAMLRLLGRPAAWSSRCACMAYCALGLRHASLWRQPGWFPLLPSRPRRARAQWLPRWSSLNSGIAPSRLSLHESHNPTAHRDPISGEALIHIDPGHRRRAGRRCQRAGYGCPGWRRCVAAGRPGR
eukprot:COSAG02_NODE_5006_length_4726_cov_21.452021_3_plen_168_part_00